MMKGFFSRLFGAKNTATASSPEDEIAVAIAVTLELYRNERKPRPSSTVRRNGPASAWSCKSYGMTPLPQRNRRW